MTPLDKLLEEGREERLKEREKILAREAEKRAKKQKIIDLLMWLPASIGLIAIIINVAALILRYL